MADLEISQGTLCHTLTACSTGIIQDNFASPCKEQLNTAYIDIHKKQSTSRKITRNPAANIDLVQKQVISLCAKLASIEKRTNFNLMLREKLRYATIDSWHTTPIHNRTWNIFKLMHQKKLPVYIYSAPLFQLPLHPKRTTSWVFAPLHRPWFRPTPYCYETKLGLGALRLKFRHHDVTICQRENHIRIWHGSGTALARLWHGSITTSKSIGDCSPCYYFGTTYFAYGLYVQLKPREKRVSDSSGTGQLWHDI